MKRIITRLLLGVSLVALWSACSNDDSHKGEGAQVPSQAVETAFWAKYPTASSVEWERAGVFQKVEFVLNSRDYDAWYASSGTWLQTEYSSTYANLPSAVKDYIANSINYPPTSWIPQESVEVWERFQYPVWYGIELKKGNQEIRIWMDEKAFNHFEVSEDLDKEDLPQAVRNHLASNYPNGWITEGWELVNGSLVVNLLDGNEVKQVHFDRSMNWVYTEWPVVSGDLPEAVQAFLRGEAYRDYSIRNASYQQYPDKEYYHVVLENTDLPGGLTISVNVDSQGQAVLA